MNNSGNYFLILKKYALGRTVVVCSPHNIEAVEWNTSYAIKMGDYLNVKVKRTKRAFS